MPNSNWVNLGNYFTETVSQQIEDLWSDKKILEKAFRQDNLEKTKLKKLVRVGIPDAKRGDIYSKILRIEKMNEYEKNYQQALRRVHGANIPENPLPPTFGGKFYKKNNLLALSKEGISIIENILCIIQHDFPNLEYCPMIVPLLSLLCHHMRNEDELLGAIVSILKKSMHRDFLSSKNGSSSTPAIPDPQTSISPSHVREISKQKEKEQLEQKPTTAKWVYLPLHSKDVKLFSRAFGNLLNRYAPKLYSQVERLHSKHNEPVWNPWLTDLFIEVLPQPVLWRFLDCFILEGYKATYRFGVGLLIALKPEIMKLNTLAEFHKLFPLPKISLDGAFQFPCSIQEFYKQANSVTINAPDIRPLKEIHHSLVAISQSEGLADTQYRFQKGQPKLHATSKIINDDHWIVIWSWIPPKLRMSELELLFTTDEHGNHLMTLFERCRYRKPLLIIIETVDAEIFGAYVSTMLPDEQDFGVFVGNGETFLFTLAPFAKLYPWIGRDIHHEGHSPAPSSIGIISDTSDTDSISPTSATTPESKSTTSESVQKESEQGKPEKQKSMFLQLPNTVNGNTYTGTGNTEEAEVYIRDKASFFVMCTKKEMIIGGGGESQGIWIDERLTQGTTGPCTTFANDALTGNKNKKRFECLRVEIFGFI
ncbi:hypothetical protein HK098_007976 [Nowakowskiella sp. JEL0407]|nr:hypothetical protein HK098_007976 [Nowakowskiella sp. JEL0407]